MAASTYCAGINANFATFTSGEKILVKEAALTRLRDSCHPMVTGLNKLGKAYLDMLGIKFITDNYVEMKKSYMEMKNIIRKAAKCGVSEECLNDFCATLRVWIPKA